MKLKTKIRLFLFLTTILTTAGISVYSYQIAKRELMQNSKDAVMSIAKQGSRNLDDRINAFQDISYRILQSANIVRLLNYTEQEAMKYKTVNEGLPAVISQQSSLSEYTRYALLRPASGVAYDYYRSGEKRLKSEAQSELLDFLDTFVDKNHPVCWMAYGGEVFFIRQIVSLDFKENGLLLFAMDDSFFEFMSDDVEYLNDDSIIVLNREGVMLKCRDDRKADKILEAIAPYQEQGYYVYHLTKELDDDRYTVTVINTQDNGWTIISYFSHSILLKGISQIYTGMIEMIGAVLVVVLFITTVISTTITRNVKLIEQGMKQYEDGHFDYRISPANYDEVGMLGLQLNYMAMKISELIQMLHLEEEEKKKLEIETLQAQINPHFLYNTLGSLKWAAYKENQKELAASLDALIHLLRFTIKKAGGMVTVGEEIAYIEHYIAIEKMRYGDRFQITYDIREEVRAWEIPGFILQPLVENCFLHGLDLAVKTGEIVIRAYKAAGYLSVEVEDNGSGMEEQTIARLLDPGQEEKKYKGFNSIGLKIVDKRLHEIYGSCYRTEIQSTKGEGTRIILRIPMGEYSNEKKCVDSR